MLLRLVLLTLWPLVALCAVHNVSVGVNGLNFAPKSIRAKKGDTVIFRFNPGDHAVASGQYDAPCHPRPGGFYSGFFTKTPGTFTVKLPDDSTRWVYCPSTGHCQSGMSMVINPPGGGKSLSNYQLRSRAATTVVPPKVRGGKRGGPGA